MDAAAVHGRAVRAAEILNDEQVRPVTGALNAGVQSGDGAVGQGQRPRTGCRGSSPPDIHRQLGHGHQPGGAKAVDGGAVTQHDERSLPGSVAVGTATGHDGLRDLVLIGGHDDSGGGRFGKTSSYTTARRARGARRWRRRAPM